MIAKLTVHGSEAVLEDTGEWTSQNQPLARLLQTSFSSIVYPSSPADGQHPFAAQVRAAAKALGSSITWGKLPPGEEGRVY